MQTLWVSMSILRNIVLGAVKNKAELRSVCEQGRITVADLDDPDIKLSLQQNCALMEASLHISRDPHLGLHIGERTTVNVLGIAGYLMETSKDLLTALLNLQQYTASFSTLYYFGIDVKDGEAVYVCEPIQVWNDLSPETARQSVDIAFAGSLHILRLLTGAWLQPLRVCYRYPRFADTKEHERVFKSAPLFNQSCNALVFASEDMNRNVIGYNRALNGVFTEMLQNKLGTENQSVIQRIRFTILELSRLSFPSLEEVAAQMHLTPRTLQRKLQDEHTSFRAECDSIKQELACNLLSSKSISVAEVSDRLGYADQAAFQRAFKQWTGTTPKAFQQKAAGTGLAS
jgi:AraC-like DNA-binding protein